MLLGNQAGSNVGLSLRENNKMTNKTMFDPRNFIYVNGNTQRILFILGEIPTEFYLFSENTHHAQNIFF